MSGSGHEKTHGSTEKKLVSQDQIDRANEDIVGVISRYVPLKKTGKNWSACCPFHSEKTPSFSVSPEKGTFYCFGCQAKGDAVGFLVDHLGVSFRDAVESINGRLELSAEPGSYQAAKPKPRAIRCDLPGHAEDPERAAKFIGMAQPVQQHPYLLRSNTAARGDLLQLKGALIVPLLNSLGEQVNVAAITANGITYAAGKPSFGSTSVLEPAAGLDGKTILCTDYAHAWRIWWAQQGRSKVLCAMDPDNLSWMLANCKTMFTHVGCDVSEADWHVECGRDVVVVPVDPYARVSREVDSDLVAS